MITVARDLAFAWWVSDHWGDPTCSEAYEQLFYLKNACSDSLADALVVNRSEIQVIRAYASRLLGQMRRAYNFDIMPAKQTWPVEEDGA